VDNKFYILPVDRASVLEIVI